MKLLTSISNIFKETNYNKVIPLFRFIYPIYIISVYYPRLPSLLHYEDLIHKPILIFKTLNLDLFLANNINTFVILLAVSLFFTSIGLFTRYALLNAAILFFIVIGNSLSHTSFELFKNSTSHSQNLIFYLLITLFCLPSSTNYSLDNYLKKIKNRVSYKWEETCLILVICSAYFGSGYTKLMTSGLKWMDGNSLQTYLYERSILFNITESNFIINNTTLAMLISVYTILLECVLIFFLLHQRIRWLIILQLVLFHTAIYYLMHINFLVTHLPFLLFFVGYIPIKRGAS